MIGFVLFIVSFILSLIFSGFLLIFGFFFSAFTSWKSLKYWFMDMAISIDQLNNVLGKDFLNLILLKKKAYCFGKPDETISSVIGKNKVKGTLSEFGKFIDKILNVFEKDHAIKSIEEDE